MPPLNKAIKGLKSIDKPSIAELKVMMNPPAGVKMVMRCICIMLDRWGRGRGVETMSQQVSRASGFTSNRCDNMPMV